MDYLKLTKFSHFWFTFVSDRERTFACTIVCLVQPCAKRDFSHGLVSCIACAPTTYVADAILIRNIAIPSAYWAQVDEQGVQAGSRWYWRYDSKEEPMKLGVSVHIGRVEVEFKEDNELVLSDEQELGELDDSR